MHIKLISPKKMKKPKDKTRKNDSQFQKEKTTDFREDFISNFTKNRLHKQNFYFILIHSINNHER